MPDGRLMVAGGHFKDAAGIKVTYFFDQNGAPQQAPSMAHGRWYPTLTVLPDGQVLSMAGRNETGAVVTTPELWTGSAWSELTGAGALIIPYYPAELRGPEERPRVLCRRTSNVALVQRGRDRQVGLGTGPAAISARSIAITALQSCTIPARSCMPGAAVTRLVEARPRDRLTPTDTAEKIDLTQASPSVAERGSMSVRRRHLNSTILPMDRC